MSTFPKFPERHSTLGMSFAEPSQAMKDWIYTDDLWWSEFDFYSGCVSIQDAMQTADSQVNRYAQQGSN